jgi:pimeloyl-ACP methyl ester carboxylesterase
MSTNSYAPVQRTVQIDGALLRVAEIGTGEPLLLINGIGVGIEAWRPLAALLAQDRRVIMFDAPGTGQSPPLASLRRMRGLVRLVQAMLDELGYDTVHVLGYSWGGVLAQQFAHDAAQRMRRLVLVSSIPGIGGMPPSPAAVTAMLDPAWRRALGTESPSLRGYLAQLYAVSGWTSLAWLHRITSPTLVIAGDADPLVPVGNARLLAARIPSARLHILRGGGHLQMFLNPDETAALVSAFLNEKAAPVGAQ